VSYKLPVEIGKLGLEPMLVKSAGRRWWYLQLPFNLLGRDQQPMDRKILGLYCQVSVN
jgi:hypothetical protein